MNLFKFESMLRDGKKIIFYENIKMIYWYCDENWK
jgi:hypothetical protein